MKASLPALALLVLLPISGIDAAENPIEIISPQTGASAVPGQPFTVRLALNAGNSLRLLVTSDCTAPHGAIRQVDDTAQTVEFSFKWAPELDPTKICTIHAAGIGSAKTDVWIDGSPIWIVPARTIAKLKGIETEATNFVGVGGCNLVKVIADEDGRAARKLDLLMDGKMKVIIGDFSTAAYRGWGVFEGLKAGTTDVKLEYADGAGSVLTTHSILEVTGFPSRQLCATLPSAVPPAPNPTGTTLAVPKLAEPLPHPTIREPGSALAPMSGTLLWSGTPDKDGLIRIEGQQAFVGSLKGDFLPGVPVKVTVTPADVIAAQAPAQSNGYQRLVLRSSRKQMTTITIRWEVIQ